MVPCSVQTYMLSLMNPLQAWDMGLWWQWWRRMFSSTYEPQNQDRQAHYYNIKSPISFLLWTSLFKISGSATVILQKLLRYLFQHFTVSFPLSTWHSRQTTKRHCSLYTFQVRWAKNMNPIQEPLVHDLKHVLKMCRWWWYTGWQKCFWTIYYSLVVLKPLLHPPH